MGGRRQGGSVGSCGTRYRPRVAYALTSLRLAVWLLLGQAVAVGALVIFLVYEELTAAGGNPRGAVLVTVYAAIMAAVLGLLAWSLHRRQRWARGPAIVLELLLLPIGYYMIVGGVPWLGLPTIALGLVGAGALLAPATREELGIQ
jgi:hypothetical protein